MNHTTKTNKLSQKYLKTCEGDTIRNSNIKNYHNSYGNRRVITQSNEKCPASHRNKLVAEFKLAYKSISPKIKIKKYEKDSVKFIKKKSSYKSPHIYRGITQTGPTIQHLYSPTAHKKKKQTKKILQNTKIEKKRSAEKKIYDNPPKSKINNHKSNLKTEGSFDSTSSCLFGNQVEIIQLIGQGTFGKVFKGRLKSNGSLVAIKRVLQDKKYKNREVEIVNMLDGQFVMKVLGTYVTIDHGSQYLNIMMDYYDGDLYQRIKNNKKGLSQFDIKLYSYQIFRGLMYIHSLDICHRDIKPHNLLVKGKHLVICDFGSAKIIKPNEANLPYICSRCYRAPELIFGAVHYTTMIDIWSVGCVILQMIAGMPLFIGQSSIDHLIEVIKVMGTPTKSQVIDMNPNYDLKDYKFPNIKKKQWSKIFPKNDALLLDLLSQIMIYSPMQRLNAAEALSHQYFDEIRQQNIYKKISKEYKLPNFFRFTQQQLNGNQHLIPKLIPYWIQS